MASAEERAKVRACLLQARCREARVRVPGSQEAADLLATWAQAVETELPEPSGAQTRRRGCAPSFPFLFII